MECMNQIELFSKCFLKLFLHSHRLSKIDLKAPQINDAIGLSGIESKIYMVIPAVSLKIETLSTLTQIYNTSVVSCLFGPSEGTKLSKGFNKKTPNNYGCCCNVGIYILYRSTKLQWKNL